MSEELKPCPFCKAENTDEESNSLLRSAWMIAKRDGKQTNWKAFRNKLRPVLIKQHKLMYHPDTDNCLGCEELSREEE